MSDKTGGPAYPVNFLEWHEDKLLPGLTMLDHFAGLAMQGLISAHTADGGWAGNYPDKTPDEAYTMAAAMLRARANHLEGEA